MNNSIKLITYDIDGTLVPVYGTTVPEENRKVIQAAKDAGCIVCPASGRSRVSLYKLLGDLVSDTYCITMNGGQIYGPNSEPVHQAYIEDELAFEITRYLFSIYPENTVVFCRDRDYLFTEDPETVKTISVITEDPMVIIKSPDDIHERIIKVSLYCQDASVIFPELNARFGDRINTAVAGKEWIDFTVTDKGRGVLDLCALLGIAPENAAAIGDNFNDQPMLEVVGHPIIMNSSNPDMIDLFPVHCESVADAIKRLLFEE